MSIECADTSYRSHREADTTVKSRRIRSKVGMVESRPGNRAEREKSVTGRNPLDAYTVEELCSRCREQIQRFRRNETTDDSFCMEVFRRAVDANDQDCWAQLQNIYRQQVMGWCRRASSQSQVSTEDLVDLTWERFWSNFNSRKLERAENTAAVQRYLKLCALSAATDAARDEARSVSLDRQRQTPSGEGAALGDSLVDQAPTPEERVTDEASRRSLWELVQRQLTSDQERALVYLKYELGLKSGEIQQSRPDLFPTVNDVYRVTRNLLDRLRRSTDLVEWFGGGDG
jgi:RNA polymerase sigma factor (sigma-70 family)